MINIFTTRRALIVIVALGLFTMALRGVNDPDIWWHLRTGELIVQQHHVLHADPFSFTRSGQPWTNHEWLSDVIIFSLYRTMGFGGLMIFFGIVIATAYLLLFGRCPGRPYLPALLIVWGALASIPIWGVRPQMFSLLLASVFLFVLENSYKQNRLLWILPLLMLLWVNLHAGYMLGIVFVALFLLGDLIEAAFKPTEWSPTKLRLKRLSAVLVICVAVVPLNPNGLKMYTYPWQTLHSHAMQSYIHEWASPDFHSADYLPLLCMILAILIVPVISARRHKPREILLLAFTMYAALLSARHLPIFMLVAVPVLSGMLDPALSKHRKITEEAEIPRKTPTGKLLLNAAILSVFVIFVAVRVHSTISHQPEIEAQAFPKSAVSFLATQKLPGPLLNHYDWGGYLIWRLYPEYHVFIDGRADLYGDSFLNDFASLYHAQNHWKPLLEKWQIRTVMLPPDAPLITALHCTGDWKQAYADRQAVILVRDK